MHLLVGHVLFQLPERTLRRIDRADFMPCFHGENLEITNKLLLARVAKHRELISLPPMLMGKRRCSSVSGAFFHFAAQTGSDRSRMRESSAEIHSVVPCGGCVHTAEIHSVIPCRGYVHTAVEMFVAGALFEFLGFMIFGK